MRSTKISGLAIDTEYTFHLVLRTSAGTFSSQKLVCRTHKMTDLSGITVTPGIMPPELRASLESAIDRIGAKIVDSIQIDTTHFVCTEGRGAAWEKAVEMNIPVVRPEWVDGCEREGTIVSVRGYYLNADPKLRQLGPGVGANQNRQHVVINQSGPASIKGQNRGSVSHPTPELQSEHRDPPVTPFPGGPRSMMHNGVESDDDEPLSPPPIPPKDGHSPNSSPSQNDSDSQSPGDYNNNNNNNIRADTLKENGYTDTTTNGENRGSSPATQPSDSAADDDRLPEGSTTSPDTDQNKDSVSKKHENGSEGEMDEVPL